MDSSFKLSRMGFKREASTAESIFFLTAPGRVSCPSQLLKIVRIAISAVACRVVVRNLFIDSGK
jgi:hypothetical protein